MTTTATALEVTSHHLDDKTVLALVTEGDCSKLNPEQKLSYYRAVCESAGVDYRARPFEFISLQGKLQLYARKACTDQLARQRHITFHVMEAKNSDGLYIVHGRARSADGQEMDDFGAVSVTGLKGDNLCNAIMKAVTKSRRRAILSMSGLGVLDETELETIPKAAIERPKPTKIEAPVSEAPKRIDFEKEAALIASEAQAPITVDHETGEVIDQPPAEAPADTITEKQAKRFFAIAKGRGMTNDQIKAVVMALGYQSSKDIRTSDYESLCSAVQTWTPTEHDNIVGVLEGMKADRAQPELSIPF